MPGLRRRLKIRLSALRYKLMSRLAKGRISAGESPNDLVSQAKLPALKPRLGVLRPGLHHVQIHDPDYLLKILQADLEESPASPAEIHETGSEKRVEGFPSAQNSQT